MELNRIQIVIFVSVLHYASIKSITEQTSFLRKAMGINVGLSLREKKIQKRLTVEIKYFNYTSKLKKISKKKQHEMYLFVS